MAELMSAVENVEGYEIFDKIQTDQNSDTSELLDLQQGDIQADGTIVWRKHIMPCSWWWTPNGFRSDRTGEDDFGHTEVVWIDGKPIYIDHVSMTAIRVLKKL